jgi:hypothetical protein
VGGNDHCAMLVSVMSHTTYHLPHRRTKGPWAEIFVCPSCELWPPQINVSCHPHGHNRTCSHRSKPLTRPTRISSAGFKLEWKQFVPPQKKLNKATCWSCDISPLHCGPIHEPFFVHRGFCIFIRFKTSDRRSILYVYPLQDVRPSLNPPLLWSLIGF